MKKMMKKRRKVLKKEVAVNQRRVRTLRRRNQNLSQNLNQGVHIKDSGGEISPLEEQQQEKDNIII